MYLGQNRTGAPGDRDFQRFKTAIISRFSQEKDVQHAYEQLQAINLQESVVNSDSAKIQDAKECR